MTYNVEILNPKAKNILRQLADLHLIRIVSNKESKKDLFQLFAKLRSKSEQALSLEEITKEVEIVRKKRHEKS